MRRTNTWADATATKEAELDLGDGLNARIPLGRPYKINQSAGRVVTVWDYLNQREQMIYGDTGWRSLPDTALLNGATATRLLIRRKDETVVLRLSGVTLGNSTQFLQLPEGFANISSRFESPGGTFQMNSARVLIAPSGWTAPTGAYFTHITFFATDVWPAILPGTAQGDISNAS